MKKLPNLLIVDDTEINLFLLEKVIGDVDVNLISAFSGKEALEKIRGVELALAIVDVQMPEMDGYELAVKLNEGLAEKIPVIFLTANNINDIEVFKGYSSGAVDYLSKPISDHVLLSKINVFLDLYNQKQAVIRDTVLLKESADELIRLNAALKKSEGQLSDIIFTMADWVWEMDENGVYTYSSIKGSELLGVSHDEIIGKTPFDFMEPAEAKRTTARFSEIIENKAAIKDFENWNISKSGERICFLTNGVPIFDDYGNFKGYRGVDKDITKRKVVEETLKQTSKRLDLAIRAGHIGVWDLDIISNNLLWDDRMFELYGISKENFTHAYESWTAGVHPDDLVQCDADIQLAIRGKKEFDTEFRVCWPDGTVHNIRANAMVLYDDAGKPLRLIGTNWDITQQKKLEEKLKSSETNFRTFFETLDDLIMVGNKQGKLIYANDMVSNKLGYAKPELYKMHLLELNPPDMRVEAEQIFADMFAGKIDTCPLPLIRKDGTKVPVETRVWFGKWNGEDCIFGLCKDLTVEQEALQKFNKIFENNPALMAITTLPEGIFTDVNNTFLSKTGYTKEEVIGKTSEELGLFVEPVKQRFASLELEKKGFIHNIGLQLKVKSGDILEGLFSGEIIESQGNKLFLTVMVDITERKRTEDLIRESESNLAEAQRIAHIGSWEWDMTSNNVKWSKEMFRVFDIDPKTYDGKPESLIKVLHPDDVELFTQSMNSNLSNGDVPTLEYRIIQRNGSIRHMYAEGRMEFDSEGKPIRAIGTVQDITERKQAEKEIHKANSFLDSIIEIIPNMIFIKDAKTLRFVRFNQAGEDLLGISKEEIVGKSDHDFFSKEQADYFVEKDREVIQNKMMLDIHEEQIQTLHQGVRILHTKKVPVLNDIGDPEFLLGISEDITERKLAEQTLKISEEKYRTMLNASPDGIFLVDFKGKITDVSDIGIELFGFENKGELLGKHFLNFIPTEGKKTILEIIEKTMNEGIAQNIELRIKKKNQALFLSEASSTLIQGADGKPFSFMIIIRDISQRKKMETKQIHADRMANLGEMASGMAHEINQPLNIISMVMDKILFESAKTNTIEIEFLKTKVDKVFENITRIKNIIDHVRAFSRSHDDYILTAFDINASIENAASMLAEQFKHLGIKLSLQLEKEIPQILGNTFKFEQVIVNLLVNAKDAVIDKKSKQEGYLDMIVGIKTYQENQSLIIEISDNGIGISNDDIHNIILPFYTTKEEGKGTGLGLSICYQIIKEMGGVIEMTSDDTLGTIIKLVLNIQKK